MAKSIELYCVSHKFHIYKLIETSKLALIEAIDESVFGAREITL